MNYYFHCFLLTFPFYVHLGNWRLHPHMLLEGLGYAIATGVFLSLRQRFGDPLTAPIRWTVVAVAVASAAVGSKVIYWLEDPILTLRSLNDSTYLLGGKTIVGALVFGVAGVEIMKRHVGVSASTGDLYAIPLAIGIAIGRLGCFLTGLSDNTYGIATALPWGVDFGDGVRRHPTQVYEIVFLLAMIPVLYRILRSTSPCAVGRVRQSTPFRAGDVFKFFMVSYLAFRLLCDFIKPYPHKFLELESIQWVCLMGLLYYSRDILRWTRRCCRLQGAL